MALFFYGFALLTILSSLMVITSRNSVHSVLWLIFAFCNGSGLMVLIGAEFIAMMLIIIYVGAVSVLFLFVVMMLDMKFFEHKTNMTSSTKFAFIMAFFLFADLVAVILLGTKTIIPTSNYSFAIDPQISNAHSIGRVLYTEFILPFQISGIILFVAMIATISLTLRFRPNVRRQKIDKQLQKNKENSLFIAKLDGKSGLNNLNYDN